MKPSIFTFFLVLLLSVLSETHSNAQLNSSFSPRCSAVYRDTLFFGGRSNSKTPTSPIIAVGDGFGRPFDSPVPIQGPWGVGKGRVSHMVVFQGDLVVAGRNSNRGPISAKNILFKYDGWWQPFPVQPPGDLSSISDVLVSGGILYLAGRFTDPKTGITENVLAYDGHQWHRLGLNHGSQYITKLCEYEETVLAAASIRGRELNDNYIHQTLLAYTISRWDGKSWITLKESKGGMPQALTVVDGDLYVGFLTLADAGPHPSVLKYDGRQWSPVGASFQTGTSGGLVKIEGLGSYRDRLVAVGIFDRVDGFQVPGAAFLVDDSWLPLGLDVKSMPHCLSTFAQTLWVGQIPRNGSPGLLFWDSEISLDTPLKPVIEPVVHPPWHPPEVPPFRNGDFSKKKDGLLIGWTYEQSPMASIRKPDEKNSFKVGADTLSYSIDGGVLVPPQSKQAPGRYLWQEFPAEKGKIYRARVKARLSQEGSKGQFPAAFSLSVGSTWDRLEITTADFRWYELELPGTDRSFSGKIKFSGSIGGRDLEIAEAQLTEHELEFALIFDTFCQDFCAQYANFKFSPVDWDSLVAYWRPIAANARDCVAFHNITKKMLGEFNDPKLTTETHNSDIITRFQTSSDPAEEARMSAAIQRSKKLYRDSPLRDGVQPRTEAEFIEVDGHQVFYLSVRAVLQRLKAESGDALLAEVARAEGILLDLRHFRADGRKPGFDTTIINNLPKVPTVALIDLTTRGTGADIAIALKEQSRVTFVGLESGTPSQVMGEFRVACGFLVQLPSCQVELSDGSIVNGRFGLVPDIPAEDNWESDNDEIREQGTRILLEKLRY